MTLSDLSAYRVIIRNPINITYHGYKITSTGVPSGGSVGLSILKIVEGYNISNPADVNLNIHRLDEAMRFSYSARSELGDPDFFGYMGDFEAKMLKDEKAKSIRGRIFDDRTRNISEYGSSNWQAPMNHGTSHVVAMDSSGLSISLTSTVNLLFGSKLVVPETGMYSYFVLNPSRDMGDLLFRLPFSFSSVIFFLFLFTSSHLLFLWKKNLTSNQA